MSRHNYHAFTDGGALLRTRPITRGAYVVDETVGRRAVEFIRRHAEDAELIIEILGLTDHEQTETT
jgi:hypothetical protein